MIWLTDLPERIASKIKVDPTTDCWEWTAHRSPEGYGDIRWEGVTWRAHRLTYRLVVGEIAPGMVIHHVCYNPPCVNPSHLRQVTTRENVLDEHSSALAAIFARATHCIRGHEFTDENTRRRPGGGRSCRECGRSLASARRAAIDGGEVIVEACEPRACLGCSTVFAPIGPHRRRQKCCSPECAQAVRVDAALRSRGVAA